MGVTRLRLARCGARNNPIYRIVAVDSRKSRDSKPIEYIGTYNPVPYALDGAKEISMQVDRVKYWLSVGAQPSERVAYLLWRANLLPAPPIHFQPKKSQPKKPAEGAAAGGAGGAAGGAAKGAKAFHTMTPFARAALDSRIPGVVTQAVMLPALASFSGLFVRPATAFRR